MNAERSEMVVARLDAGATMQEIATELGVSRQRVGQLASAHPGYSGRGGRDARQEIATEAAAAAVEAGAVVTDIDRNAWRRRVRIPCSLRSRPVPAGSGRLGP